ncbi:zinc finger MYM-type protein 4-like [Oculina patagonica]
MRDNGRPELNFFTDPAFKHFQDCLDAEMKRLTGMGVGSKVKEAQAFSEEEENKLWNLGLLGDSSPKVLLDTMVFLIGKTVSLRSGKEHRNLKFSQLTLEPANAREPEKLVYVSFGEKNNLGGLKHRSFKQKRIEHYANSGTPQRCLVQLYKKYVSKCPEPGIAKDAFYLTARRAFKDSDDVWYGTTPVGHNMLGETVKRLCKDAGIEGQFTNHSLRATTATRALKKGIPDKFVMERTGHRDLRSLQKYQRPDTSTKVEFSKAFDSGEALSLSDSLGSVNTPVKREVEQDDDTISKFANGLH